MKWIAAAMIACLASLPVTGQTTGAGSALSFDGGGAYVAIATTGSLTGTFTVEPWASANVFNNLELICSRTPVLDFGFDIQLGAWLFGGETRIHGDIGNGSDWLTSFADAYFPYETGTWHHFAYVVT